MHDRCLDTSTGALPLTLDLQSEFPKMALVWQLIAGNRDNFPEDALNVEEKVGRCLKIMAAQQQIEFFSTNTSLISCGLYQTFLFPVRNALDALLLRQ